jgi:molybdopterin molybdotransferase
MALFKHNQTEAVEEEIAEVESKSLPVPPPVSKDGLRDFWQHWDYLLGMVPELSEFGVPVLDAVGLTINESILAEEDLGSAVKAGDVLVDKGSRVVPRMLSLLTELGITKVMARPNPRVLVMALSQQAVPASYLVAAQAKVANAQVHRMEYIFDSLDATVKAVVEQLVRADLIITVGRFGEVRGHLRQVADLLGPHDFTPVAISPGRDHGFALAEERVPLLALPADAYSTFVLTKLLVEPMIAKLMGANTDPVLVGSHLAQPLRVVPKVLTCVPASVKDGRMKITGRPTGMEGLHTIYRANALAILTSEDGLVSEDSETFYLPLP